MNYKKCSICGQVLPIDKFYKRSKKGNLYRSSCIDCERLNHIWYGMKERCYNKSSKSYINYGARGITMCEEWKNSYKSFEEWAIDNGYDRTLTIDRIDVNGDYEPLNCKWSTRQEQSLNQRVHKNTQTGIRGVYPTAYKGYLSVIVLNGKFVFRKTYKTLDEAIRHRNTFIKENDLPNKLSEYPLNKQGANIC